MKATFTVHNDATTLPEHIKLIVLNDFAASYWTKKRLKALQKKLEYLNYAILETGDKEFINGLLSDFKMTEVFSAVDFMNVANKEFFSPVVAEYISNYFDCCIMYNFPIVEHGVNIGLWPKSYLKKSIAFIKEMPAEKKAA